MENDINTQYQKRKLKESSSNFQNVSSEEGENSMIINNNNDDSFMKKKTKNKSQINSEFHNSPNYKPPQTNKAYLTLKIPNINISTSSGIKTISNQKISYFNETEKRPKFNTFLRSTGNTNTEININSLDLKSILKKSDIEYTNLNETNNNIQQNTRNVLEGILNKNEKSNTFYTCLRNDFKIFDKSKKGFRIKYPDNVYMKKELNDEEEKKKEKERKLDDIFAKKMNYKNILKENLDDIKLKYENKKKKQNPYDLKFATLYKTLSKNFTNISDN